MFIRESLILECSWFNIPQLKLFQVCILVSVGFFFGWMPYALVGMWSTYGDVDQVPMWLSILPALLAKTSAAYNPVMYFFVVKRFRKNAAVSFSCHVAVIFEMLPFHIILIL